MSQASRTKKYRVPLSEKDFTIEWITPIINEHYFKVNGKDVEKIRIKLIKAAKNNSQGILSTTFVADVFYEDDNPQDEFEEDSEISEEGLRKKSIFIKVPLEAGNEAEAATFEAVNKRELIMLTQVLPKLQRFLDKNCQGLFRLPMPECLRASYGDEAYDDVFILENLCASGYENFDEKDCLDLEHMKSVLECLSQLHGTGLAYKKLTGSGNEDIKDEFPGLEEQIQLKDLFANESMKARLKQNFRAFLHFLEDEEPKLATHTSYMKNMHRHILGIVEALENSSCERLLTFCHGDAKPNNFLFRRIEIDIDGLECSGLQSILIDWQGGFLGSVANDLMWALFPFLEAHKEDKTLYKTAIDYYHEQLGVVLESFGCTLKDLALPQESNEFASLLQKSLVLEFLIVTIIKPILGLPEPEKLLKWHKETVRNQRRRFKKRVQRPDLLHVVPSQRFPSFCHLYFRIATRVGAFQEMGRIYFSLVKDGMFEDPDKRLDLHDSDVDDPDPDPLYRIINTPFPERLGKMDRKSWLKVAVTLVSVMALIIALVVASCQ